MKWAYTVTSFLKKRQKNRYSGAANQQYKISVLKYGMHNGDLFSVRPSLGTFVYSVRITTKLNKKPNETTLERGDHPLCFMKI